MIKLVEASKAARTIYVNPANIIQIRQYPNSDINGSIIEYDAHHFSAVAQSPEHVAWMISRYNRRQMKLQALYGVKYAGWKSGWNEEISKLESEDRGE